jgi:hypothetical protein
LLPGAAWDIVFANIATMREVSMTEAVAYRFIEALEALERSGELEPIVDTFAEACDIGNSLSTEQLQGKDGAVEYWKHYRRTFRDMRSTFRHIIVGDNSIALEWTTYATDHLGKQFCYDGVTILDIAGREITRFRAYFDTKKMGERIQPQQARSAGNGAELSSAVGS